MLVVVPPGDARFLEASADESGRAGQADALVSGLQASGHPCVRFRSRHVPQARHHDVRLPDRQVRALVSPQDLPAIMQQRHLLLLACHNTDSSQVISFKKFPELNSVLHVVRQKRDKPK